jgi:exodeoxyribonuclease VII small subunit
MSDDLIPVKELNYEQAFAELEAIVSSLELEEPSLEQTLKQFERGQELAKYCMGLLEKAELKVQQLSGEDLIPFEER